jgi:hypothetical protein
MLFPVEALLPLHSQQELPLINARRPAMSGLPCTTLVIAFSTRHSKAYHQDSAIHHAMTPQALLHSALLKLGLLAVLVGVRLQTTRDDLWPLLIPIQAADLLPEGVCKLSAMGGSPHPVQYTIALAWTMARLQEIPEAYQHLACSPQLRVLPDVACSALLHEEHLVVAPLRQALRLTPGHVGTLSASQAPRGHVGITSVHPQPIRSCK